MSKWLLAFLPQNIRDSFADAIQESRITKTMNSSNHVLLKDAVAADNLDFDWAIWLVLQAVYYDTDSTAKRLSFKNSLAAMRITERYQGIDVLYDNFPITDAPRPSKWGRIANHRASNSEFLPIGQGDSQQKPTNPSIQPSGITHPLGKVDEGCLHGI
ncbi:hypothetical protein EDB82DRAFT_556212 [Fusarium venenatum]|uniref:uncharacterized protein n=1 Tax=Fusarium venenatum TaxID=56646 RepID=UPI001DFEFE1B|nr:hypothetical protein EDB82DRAFT_556212 [Fusarium venenatum]